MREITKDELTEILNKHQAWLRDEDGGGRADLSYADLRYADLRSANLSPADLRYADLRYANLSSANLSPADLRYADLRSANLSSANLSYADLRYADLRYANLSSANLSYADLRYANLRYANGNAAQLKTIYLETYPIAYTAEYLQIGCERHPISDWWAFDDARIAKMDGTTASAFWGKWKTILRQLIEMSPATPTGHKSADETPIQESAA